LKAATRFDLVIEVNGLAVTDTADRGVASCTTVLSKVSRKAVGKDMVLFGSFFGDQGFDGLAE